MKTKKFLSLILSVMIMFTVVCGCFAVTANASSTVTYSFVVSTTETVNAYEGVIYYPSAALKVQNIVFEGGQKNDVGGRIQFNKSNIDSGFDFSGGKTMISVEFEVLGAYDADQVYGELTEFYNINDILGGNTPFDYSNVLDGEVVSCGHTDLDVPANSYANTKYTVIYSYKENPTAEADTTYTKSVWSNLTTAQAVSQFAMPRIENPYYDNYFVASAVFADTTTVRATLGWEIKKYNVTLNGTSQGQFSYLQEAEVTSSSGVKDFIISGNRVASGTTFSFYVTGDMDITTEEPSGALDESATIIQNALYVTDNSSAGGYANVKMEMLATATATGFTRMGVAFAKTNRSAVDVSAAASAVIQGTGKSNGIAVHNSLIDNPNMSGQYQFIYAPYAAVSKINKDTSLYFYTFVENGSGDIIVSQPSQVSFANVLA